MPHFAYLKRCSMASRSDSNITPNSLDVSMRKTYTKKVKMTKINKVFDKYFDLCETILF